MSTDKAGLARFLIDLGRAGVWIATVSADPKKVRHKPAVLPADIAERLPVFRPHLLALLRLGYGPADDAAQDAFDERLRVAAENGLPVDPGSPAWLAAVGESMLAEIGGGT